MRYLIPLIALLIGLTLPLDSVADDEAPGPIGGGDTAADARPDTALMPGVEYLLFADPPGTLSPHPIHAPAPTTPAPTTPADRGEPRADAPPLGTPVASPSIDPMVDVYTYDEAMQLYIDAERVAAQEGAVADSVYFGFDQARLDAKDRSTLRALAEAYHTADDHDGEVTIRGHADPRGPSAYNTALSWDRAMAVKDTLIDYGVPEVDIRLEAYGETSPQIERDTGSAHALNRRVDVIVER